MNVEPSVVVFTDIDCLSGLSTSRDAECASVLRMAVASEMPLVLCSTRTRAELESIQQDLNVRHPFLCENGAAVFVPRGYFDFAPPHARPIPGYDVIEFGRPHADVVHALHRTAADLQIDVVGFADMSIADVARDGGLSLLEARLAKLREYGEPFRIPGAESSGRQRVFRALWTQGHGCTTGGRYDYVGSAFDESAGIHIIRGLYRRAFGPVVTVGCGDPRRDAALLQSVDIPLAVQCQAAEPAASTVMKLPAARFAFNPGMGGWVAGLRWLARVAGRRMGLTRPRARWA